MIVQEIKARQCNRRHACSGATSAGRFLSMSFYQSDSKATEFTLHQIAAAQ
jgi:hypothetical protein